MLGNVKRGKPYVIYFFDYMKKDNLKRIIRDLESLLTELKSEVYSDTEAYVHPWYEKTGAVKLIASIPIDKYELKTCKNIACINQLLPIAQVST